MWISHPSFKDLVASMWNLPVEGNPQFILNQKLTSHKTRLKTWNKEVFGNLKTNISTAENNILLLQESMDSVPLDSTKSALSLARCTLQNLLQAEETHWKQKSRVNWLQEGNRNTKFFHLASKIRGSKNRIDKVEFKGISIESHPQIKAAAVEFFSDNFKPSPIEMGPRLFQVHNKKVSPTQNSILQAVPFNEEIKNSVFNLNKS
ncbi:hypothetical protein MRB53_005666 [Persea americana]|uniref:Uncharacterized protein n=1 Tax=Persea americana TaxID=3435 RepID=A0ACC2MEU9_PERAE|nr:hypothetical protein MRB53_005666 [Persea americana]